MPLEVGFGGEPIEAALQRAAHADAKGISVSIANGSVRLAGKVHSMTERRTVEGATRAAPGVSSIVDQLVGSP